MRRLALTESLSSLNGISGLRAFVNVVRSVKDLDAYF
jgi:hypothetical protein